MRLIVFQLAIGIAAALFFALPSAARAADNSTQHGSSIYQANCATCHGDDGSGSAVGKSLHAPDLRSAKVQTKSNAALARFIREGNGAMPAFEDRLDPQQILDEVWYIRSLGKHHGAHE